MKGKHFSCRKDTLSIQVLFCKIDEERIFSGEVKFNDIERNARGEGTLQDLYIG